MPIVTFFPLGIRYRVRPGGSLLRAAMRARMPMARACRGDAVCASCRVQVLTGAEHLAAMTGPERALAARDPLAAGERYACQAAVQGDVTITTRYWGASGDAATSGEIDPGSPGRRAVAAALREQAGWCAKLGSPLYATLLEQAARDAEAGGPVWALLSGHEADPRGSALALRLMGAIHRLVLEDHAPALARFYPSVGGHGPLAEAWPAFVAVLARHRDALVLAVCRPVQTNEVGRSAVLCGGFLQIARETGLPLRLLELGTAAGLNLRWDHFRYEDGPSGLGDPTSRIRFTGLTGLPLAEPFPRIVERAGCDIEPIDPTTEAGRTTLLAYVWADQEARIERLRAALDIAARIPVRLVRQAAPDFAEAVLASPAPGCTTVLFHSIVSPYLGRSDRERLERAITQAGARASTHAPLAWLRLEAGGEQAELRLTLWPDGRERLLARAGFHGSPIEWIA